MYVYDAAIANLVSQYWFLCQPNTTSSLSAMLPSHEKHNFMQAALNIDNSVSQIGFYGPHSEKLWCLSHTETLHLWEWLAACDEESTGFEIWSWACLFVHCHAMKRAIFQAGPCPKVDCTVCLAIK